MKDYKKKIAELKQLYSVKGVKTFRGHEGIGFNASLYKAKKKIAFVIDDASGCLSYIEEEDMEAIKELDLACENVGQIPTVLKGGGRQVSTSYLYSIRRFVQDLVNDYLDKKALKKKVQK